MGNFGGSLASITSKEKKNIKSIAKSGTSPEASQKTTFSQICHVHQYSDMEFVKKFTLPDFQAKHFTPSISPVGKNTKN